MNKLKLYYNKEDYLETLSLKEHIHHLGYDIALYKDTIIIWYETNLDRIKIIQLIKRWEMTKS